MGKFSKNVRRNKIAGPNQRGFIRSEWEFLLTDLSLDEDDKRILHAGLFFDELLCFLRKEKKISDNALKPTAIIRIVIAIATLNLFRIVEQTKMPQPTKNSPSTLNISKVMQQTLQLPTGQFFAPDELISGSGDGMKHMLRELLAATADPEKLSEYEADNQSVDEVNNEFNKAIVYQCAVEYWLSCVGNGYGLAEHEQGISLIPFDKPLEIARTVSTYRRLSITLQDTMLVTELWLHTWPRKVKEKLCEIPLVSRIAGQDRIDHIELGLNSKVLNAASSAIAAKLWLQHGYYRSLLDDPMPNFSGFTLNQIILGWRLLQSLSVVIFDSLKSIETEDIKSLLRFAPRISKRALSGTFSRALSLDQEQSDLLINVFVFDPDRSQEVWFQPLIPHEDDYCLVIPCIHSVHLQRIIEGWMRQGGLDLDRRGPEFEKFCRDDLAVSLRDSPIKESVTILSRGVRFKPLVGRPEEIDIVIVIANTVLLIEAKCILWPDDELQFANYRDTVEKAAKQIVRKRDAVQRNYENFSDRLKQLGYSPPAECNLVCCVLTNSAVFSGFPFEDVSIVDLSILGSFFKNEHVKMEERQAGITIQRHAINFYTDARNAGEVLGKYLADPPQLSDSKLSVKKREIIFPIESSTFGKLMHEIYSVEIDEVELRKRYGLQAK